MSSPLVKPDRQLAELTVKAVILGALLSILLAAANAYIGLLVGLTVSASIPAAAVSMGIFKLFKRSNILENNMVQTAASAGESLVAGVIFTLPGLVMLGAWQGYSFSELSLIAGIGGVLGVAFTVPLRHALIVDAKLMFPEGVATSEVLKSGGIETGGDQEPEPGIEVSNGLPLLLKSSAFGALFKLAQSGFGWLSDGVSGIWHGLSGRLLVSGDVTYSSALLGVGYIVGFNIAFLVFLGGLIGTGIGVPLNWALNGDHWLHVIGLQDGTALTDLTGAQWQQLADAIWQANRRIGVGAMMVGGVWSLVSLAGPLSRGIKASWHAYKGAFTADSEPLLRTERDAPLPYLLVVVVLSAPLLWWIFDGALAGYPGAWWLALVMTALMLVFGFLFSSVAGYMAGLVGSSNNPISGITIATVIVASLILFQLMGDHSLASKIGPIAVLYLAGLICSAAAIAGDNMQDLKCGHVVGATPWRQQVMQVIGVIAAAMAIPWVLQILDAGYGIGRPLPGRDTFLPAPQAGLMKDLANGIFGGALNWNYIYLGMLLGVVVILIDEFQKRRGSSFRFPILAIAVGIYLPWGLSIPMMVGGVLAAYNQRHDRGGHSGVLAASGLITGEALMGVILAMIAAFITSLASPAAWANWLSLPVFIVLAWWLAKVPARQA